MNSTIIIIIIYFLILFILGFYINSKKKTIKKSKDSKLSTSQLTISIIMTLFGGGFILGGAELGYSYGWQGLIYGFSTAIGLLLFGPLLAKKIYSSKKEYHVNTLSGFLYKKYENKTIYLFSSALSIITLITISSAQLFAATKIFNAIGLPEKISLFFLGSIILLISSKGLKKLSSFGRYNLLIAVIGIISLLFLKPEFESEIIKKTASSIKPLLLLNILIPTVFYILVGQDIYQKVYSSKNIKSIKTAMFLSSLFFILLSIFPVIIGIKANQFLEISPSEAVPKFILYSAPSIFKGLFIAAILAAVIGCAQSLLNAAANQFSEDLGDFLKKENEKKKIFSIGIIMMALITFFITLVSKRIIDNLIIAYSIYTSGIFLLLFFAFFTKNSRKYRYPIIYGSVLSLILTLLIELKIIKTQFPSIIVGIIFGAIFILILILLNKSLKRDNKRKVYKEEDQY